MSSVGEEILECLRQVVQERALREGDAALTSRVMAIKQWQHARFEASYSDLLTEPRYASAARFFLDDLYGAADFSARDAQFARIVPGLVRLFPREIVGTVLHLAQLHALSERMDTLMAQALGPQSLDATSYAQAWRAVGRVGERERQIDLMLSVGRALDRYVKNPLLRHSLRVMRKPAEAAGLGALQNFLERGFDTFRAMRGADPFLTTIAVREREFSARLFGGGA
jgi:hypothetical protein